MSVNQFQLGDRIISDSRGIGFVVYKDKDGFICRFGNGGCAITYDNSGNASSGDYVIPYPQWFDILETLIPSFGLIAGIIIGVWAW